MFNLESSSHEADDAALRSFFGRGWQEVGVLGSGARGPVRLVRAVDPDRVAFPSSALKRSTVAEVRALQALSRCSNIVALEEHFAASEGDVNHLSADDSHPCWARLEWLQGGDLRTFLRSAGGQVPHVTAAFIVSEVLLGLESMHSKGWMHRDVKADNIGLSGGLPSDGSSDFGSCRVKLLDFDSAALVPHGSCLTEVIGTVENMAPEVFEASYDERADCWSLGVVCHQLLFGYRPFNDVSVDGIEEMVRNWRQYLHLPSEPADEPTEFVRTLLVDRTERPTSLEALQHPWMARARAAASQSAPPESSQDSCAASKDQMHLEVQTNLQLTEKKDIRPLALPTSIPSPARSRCTNAMLTAPSAPLALSAELIDPAPPLPSGDSLSHCEDGSVDAAKTHEEELGDCLDRIRSLIKELEKNAADTASICSASRAAQHRA